MKTALIFLLFAASIEAHAGTRNTGDVELTLMGFSHHFEKEPVEGKKWNQTHPGIGIRYFVKPRKGFETFLDANYIGKNSTGGRTKEVGVGIQRQFASLSEVQFLFGIGAGLWDYYNSWENKRYLSPAVYPTLGIRYGKLTGGTLIFIPKITVGETETYPVVFFGVNIKF